MKITNPLAKNAFQEFADIHSLVYSPNFEEDAHAVVRGIMLSNNRKDEYLVQGNIEGHDIQLLQRSVHLHNPDSEKLHVKLAIMHLTLPNDYNLPHVFLDGNNRYHENVYENIFTKFHKLVLAPAPHPNTFMSQYRVFCNPETIPSLPELLPQELTTRLSSLGHVMDYELLGNGVYIYLPDSTKKAPDLDQMLSAIKLITKSVLRNS